MEQLGHSSRDEGDSAVKRVVTGIFCFIISLIVPGSGLLWCGKNYFNHSLVFIYFALFLSIIEVNLLNKVIDLQDATATIGVLSLMVLILLPIISGFMAAINYVKKGRDPRPVPYNKWLKLLFTFIVPGMNVFYAGKNRLGGTVLLIFSYWVLILSIIMFGFSNPSGSSTGVGVGVFFLVIYGILALVGFLSSRNGTNEGVVKELVTDDRDRTRGSNSPKHDEYFDNVQTINESAKKPGDDNTTSAEPTFESPKTNINTKTEPEVVVPEVNAETASHDTPIVSFNEGEQRDYSNLTPLQLEQHKEVIEDIQQNILWEYELKLDEYREAIRSEGYFSVSEIVCEIISAAVSDAVSNVNYILDSRILEKEVQGFARNLLCPYYSELINASSGYELANAFVMGYINGFMDGFENGLMERYENAFEDGVDDRINYNTLASEDEVKEAGDDNESETTQKIMANSNDNLSSDALEREWIIDSFKNIIFNQPPSVAEILTSDIIEKAADLILAYPDTESLINAAKAGVAGAQTVLGLAYFTGINNDTYLIAKNKVKAEYWLNCGAKQGSIFAQKLLSMIYLEGDVLEGDGFEMNYTKAVEWLTQAAKRGDAWAQNYLGFCYSNGRGVEQNYENGVDWFKMAAEQGYATAQCNLGICYRDGSGVEQNSEKAAEWFTKAAIQGNADAQDTLGCFYSNGVGVDQNYEKATEWFRKAAEQGDADAQYHLGCSYYTGQGTEQNSEKAIGWWEKAAEQGNADAQNNMGGIYYNGLGVEQNYDKAVEWFIKAAKQGDATSQYHMGLCYYNGDGVEQNYEKAVEWWKKAAEQGYAGAQNNLGSCYNSGEGVKQNYEKAVEWFTKAAEQHHQFAQNNLGDCYYKGNGVEQDYEKAVEWYKLAAAQNHSSAQNNLGVCYEKGFGVEQNYDVALEWFRKAAEQEDDDAQCNIGQCYYYGKGVEQNYEKAVEWLSKAAEQDNAEAQYFLGLCFYEGNGVVKSKIKTKEWMEKAIHQNYDEALKFAEEHPDIVNGLGNVSNTYNVSGDVIKDNRGIIAKDDAVVNRANITQTETNFCPGCGSPVEAGDQFCRKCGRKLT